MGDQVEIEAKFVADGELLERLAYASKVAGWPVAERSRLRLETVYYDTVDRRLAEHDCALRLRRGEPEGPLLSFKRGRVAGGISRREEIETAVPADYDPAQPVTRPQPLVMAEAVARGRRLEPVLILTMDRTVLLIVAGDARMHLCLDGTSRPDMLGWRDHEIEVELDKGPEKGFAEFVSDLQRAHDLKPSNSSKIERAKRASIDLVECGGPIDNSNA